MLPIDDNPASLDGADASGAEPQHAQPPPASVEESGEVGRELGWLAVSIGAANLLLLALLVMSMVGVYASNASSADVVDETRQPAALPIAVVTDRAATSVPPGFRAVCFHSTVEFGTVRSKPAFGKNDIGLIRKGDLVELAGRNPPVTRGPGFVMVRFNGKTGWMHRDILKTEPCPR